MVKIIGFDTETVFDGYSYYFYSFQAYSPELGLKLFSTSPDEIEKVFNRQTRGAILLMKKMEYDLAVLRKILPSKQYKMVITYNKAKPVKALILRQDLRQRYVWRVYDLENLFPLKSLAQIGQLIGCQKLPRPSYLGLRPPQGDDEIKSFKTYALRDAEICYRAGKYILDKFNKLRPTLPALAFWDLTNNYVKGGLFKKWLVDNAIWLKQFYKGGRVEAFWRGTLTEKVFVYDVNSLYPFVMAHFSYPKFFVEPKVKSDINLSREGIAKVKVCVDADIPPLAIRYFTKDKQLKLVFPSGVFTGYFTYPELRLIENSGIGKILKVFKACECKESYQPFTEFVETYHKLKNTDEKNREFWKIYLNSVYGKFGQSGQIKSYKILSDGQMKEFQPKIKRPKNKKQWIKQNYIISAYITAYARLYMWHQLKKVGFENVIYTDTDSIITTKHLHLEKGGLGQLELKYQTQLDEPSTFIRSKFYILGDVIKCRGLCVPITAKVLRNMIAKENTELEIKRLLRLRSAVISHLKFLTEVARKFTPSFSEDGKRVYLKSLNGKELINQITNSQPLTLKNAEEVVKRA
ncbi:MAG: hypothetical protein KIH08_14895 [Candidatus Freyarchaeota archaeon]|nr:hypothetical protein [Candidatus Jordarchaeia archaeon]